MVSQGKVGCNKLLPLTGKIPRDAICCAGYSTFLIIRGDSSRTHVNALLQSKKEGKGGHANRNRNFVTSLRKRKVQVSLTVHRRKKEGKVKGEKGKKRYATRVRAHLAQRSRS